MDYWQILNMVSSFIQSLLILYIGTSVLYFSVFAFLSIFPLRKSQQKSVKQNRICVLIPAYQEDEIILETALSAQNQNYPSALYDVYVIADSFKKETLKKLAENNVNFYEVEFIQSTKAKSINYAFSQMEKDYDLTIILDADNIMENDFLMKMNNAFGKGILALQGHRIAKNTNTNFALLDAISEEINNNVFRKGLRQVGFSASLIGSAMGFRYDTFKQVMSEINAVGGFDKQLELKLIKRGIKIHYQEDAYVYDEKIQNSKDFTTQRKRWLWAQFYYLRKDFLISFWYFIAKGNIDYFNKAFQFIQLPRILILGLLFIINIFSLLFNEPLFQTIWASLLILNVLGFLFAVPKKFYKKKTFIALLSLPMGFFKMFLALLTMKKAKNNFLHTKHTVKGSTKK